MKRFSRRGWTAVAAGAAAAAVIVAVGAYGVYGPGFGGSHSAKESPAPQELTGGYKLVWHDEFNGKNGSPPDPKKWTPQLGTGTDYGLPAGWGNNELETYTNRPENVVQQDGKLLIRALREASPYQGREYTSARLVTQNHAEWTYGRFEIRARLPHGENLQGIWPAIWMMPSQFAYGNWPQSGEIDIMEKVGKDPMRVLGTLHFGMPWRHPSEFYKLPDDGFHTYAIEWERDQIRFYVDDALYGTRTKDEWYSSGGTNPAPFDKPFYLLLNVAVGGDFPGYPAVSSVYPQTMEVDYVRVYQK